MAETNYCPRFLGRGWIEIFHVGRGPTLLADAPRNSHQPQLNYVLVGRGVRTTLFMLLLLPVVGDLQ